MDNNDALIVTIDGPSGTGKSTITRLLSRRLGFWRLESGSLYRALAWCVMTHAVNVRDAQALRDFIQQIDIKSAPLEHGVYYQNQEITSDLEKEEVGQMASVVAQLPNVREALLSFQRAMCAPPGLVAEGRDMGTVVFPYADVKFFLYANLACRVQRRSQQLANQSHDHQCLPHQSIQESLSLRDQADSERHTAPLVAAQDAHYLDTTFVSIEQTLDYMMRLIPHFVL